MVMLVYQRVILDDLGIPISGNLHCQEFGGNMLHHVLVTLTKLYPFRGGFNLKQPANKYLNVYIYVYIYIYLNNIQR